MGKKQKAALNALAEGIECGAKLRPQCQMGLMQPIDREQNYGSCALGAAAECALVKQGVQIDASAIELIRQTGYDEILAAYGVMNRVGLNYITVEDGRGNQVRVADDNADIAGLIWHLNDWQLWTRERIAAFLRELE